MRSERDCLVRYGEAGGRNFSEYALSVYDVKAGKTVSQVEVGRKENGMSKAPEAVKMAKTAGKVVTGDALHTQKRPAQAIVAEQGDDVFPIKENQPGLSGNIQALFAPGGSQTRKNPN